MNISRYHAEWLSLIEVSGPFVSMPVLLRTFPQGLDELDAGQRRDLRANYETWLERGQKHAGHHHAWIRYVLTRLLDYPDALLAEGQSMPPGMEAVLPRFHETLRPDLALKSRDAGGKPVLLISVFPSGTRLESPLPEHNWKASPATRMMELLHATGITTGLVTNGEQWLLVYARCGEATGFASWYADLWMQEPVTLLAFRSLLHLRRFFGVATPDTLPSLLDASSHDQQEVTDQLGFQVRQAVEVLVQAFDRIDAESARTLLAGVDEPTLYSASLTIMMRLVFVFAAEERGMLLLGQNAFYDENYALSPLRDSLRERADQHGEEVLERRYDAWCRLLAAFRAIHGGVEHEAMRLPAYGGALFDPDRYPFLEGRAAGTAWVHTPATPLQINNRVVLHLLEALQLLRVKLPGGGPAEMRRLSFRALDIEQIGHVYEGLLDHTVKRAPEVVLGLSGAKDKEPEIPLSKLEALARRTPSQSAFDAASDQDDLLLMAAEREQGVQVPEGGAVRYGQPSRELLDFLKEETGRQPNLLTKSLAAGYDVDEHRLQRACGNDQRLVNRVRPFAALIREDSFNQLVVIPEGSYYVTRGSDRRSSGTHYTPRSLTEPIVQHTLEPLVYVGPAEGKPEGEWVLKSPKELLDLRVCDLAMGSAAFLVQTCRYLSERLVEAWETIERGRPDAFLKTPEGEVSTGDPSERLLPADSEERLAIARRIVADRCLYGVDINPMAVEMAKLSLWLITLHKDRPFTFLDHALKCGDSLLGVTSVKQIENFSLRKKEGDYVEHAFSTINLFRYVEEASDKRRALEALPSNDHAQIEAKKRLHAEAEAATAKVKALADCLIAFELLGIGDKQYAEQRIASADRAELAMHKPLPEFQSYARKQLCGLRPFHWAVEFPEVFEKGGFNSFIGNPPFIGNKYWRSSVGEFLSKYAFLLLDMNPGHTDICSLFHRRAFGLTKIHGNIGLLGCDSLKDGDSYEVGLRVIAQQGHIYRANSSFSWPGTATVRVCIVWVARSSTNIRRILDNKPATLIDGHLTDVACIGEPYILLREMITGGGCHNARGEALILTNNSTWFSRLYNAKSPYLRTYVTGDDMNTHAFQNRDRWCVYCGDESIDIVATKCPETALFLHEVVKPVRTPAYLEQFPGLANRWWQFHRPAADLFRAASKRSSFIVLGVVTKYVIPARVPSDWIATNKFCVVVETRPDLFSCLTAQFFEDWVRRYSGDLGETLSISLSRGVQTFPLPSSSKEQELIDLGRNLIAIHDSAFAAQDMGYTDLYNAVHDRTVNTPHVLKIREVRQKIDEVVAEAYGLKDLDLGHGFHETKQGIRFTISESARRIVLDRLLALNHERYEEEVKAGLHEKKKPAKAKKAEQLQHAPAKGTAVQFGLGLDLVETDKRSLPTELRLPAKDPILYAMSLVLALLSEAGGSLPWSRLLDAFVVATTPTLMKKAVHAKDRALVDAWAKRWNEGATPDMLLPSIVALGGKNLDAFKGATERVFQLLDGPRRDLPAEAVYDAWLALYVTKEAEPDSIPVPQKVMWTKTATELVFA